MGMSSLFIQSLSPSLQLLTLCCGLSRSQRGHAPGQTASSSAHSATPSAHAVVRFAMRSVGSASDAQSRISVRFCFSVWGEVSGLRCLRGVSGV